MSPSSRSGIVVWVVAIGKSRAHRPHRARRAPPPASPSRVASAPGPWLARIAPHASLFRRMREKGPLPGNIRPKCMLFEIGMATSSPHASISGRNRAIQDAWRANLAAKGPLSRRAARNHARREDVASAARDFRGSGLRSGRTGFAPCGSGMRHAAIRRAAHCGRGEPPIGLFLPPSCCPRRRIAPTDARSPAPPGPQPVLTEPQPRANRTSAPRQPSPAHTWSRLLPPAPRHSPRLTLPRGFRCGSGNSREMVR